MGTYINDCGKHVYAWIDGEWIDVTDVLDACVHLAEEEDELTDDDVPFCDEHCDECDSCDLLDDYDVDEEPLFWGIPDVRRIVFNDPATIVFWDDGTKTVVKCMAGEKFERYAGFAMACMKKMFGSTSRAKAIMEECDTENLKRWHEEALKPMVQAETKHNPAEKKYETKYKPLDYTPFINKFADINNHMDKTHVKENDDGTPAE